MEFSLCLAALVLYFAAKQDAQTGMVYDRYWMLLLLLGVLRLCETNHNLIGFIVGYLGIGLPILGYALWPGGSIGGGDIKLCAALGALLGLTPTFWLLVLALVLFVVCLWMQKRKNGPFVPAIFISFSIYLIRSVTYV